MPPVPPVIGQYYTRKGPATAKVEVEAYVDYCCPFSAKLYPTLFEQVFPALSDEIAVTLRHQVQPWHPQSPVMHEHALAVKMLAGDDAFWQFSTALFAQQTDFFDANSWNLSRNDISDKLCALAASICKIDKDALQDLVQLAPEDGSGALNRGNKVTATLKLAIKEGRQSGVHVSPSCKVNGLLTDTSSSWTVADWNALLAPLISAASVPESRGQGTLN